MPKLQQYLFVSGYFMVTLRNYIIASFGLYLLTQCNTLEGNTTVSSSVTVRNVDNPLAGEWKYDNTIWYSSALVLHDDGTFTFHDQSCNGQRFSQGHWARANGSISLTSFDAFRQKEVVEPTKTVEVTEQGKRKRKLKRGEVEYSFVGFKATTLPKFPNATDTVRIYFDNIQMQLRNDSLICVSSNKLPEQAKFYKAKNNR